MQKHKISYQRVVAGRTWKKGRPVARYRFMAICSCGQWKFDTPLPKEILRKVAQKHLDETKTPPR